LNRPPQQVTLLDVLAIFEGDEEPATNCTKSSPLCSALLNLRVELYQAQRDRLESLTLADVVEGAVTVGAPMWYI
jgi:DNA-binding IscR family transcriptional regulator